MDVVVVGRHTKVSEDFRSRVIEKLRRIETVDVSASRIDVVVVHERNSKVVGERERVELTVHGRHPLVRAEASSDDRHVALDLAVDRLVDRLRKRHERRSHRHQDHAASTRSRSTKEAPSSVEPWEDAPDTATREIPLDGSPIVIRSKTHAAVPMTTSEAIDQMELVGHDFFLFHDVESGLPSAVYRRRGWTYGVIHLERADLAGSRKPGLKESA